MNRTVILSSILFFGIFIFGYGQCKTFAKDICKNELKPYIHDGNYNAAILFEGEDAELFKTFNSGMQYRIAVCCSDVLPKVEFVVKDLQNNILFDNKTKNYCRTWDFKVESTQQLQIIVKIPAPQNQGGDIASGCVAIMFGILDK